MVAAAVKSFVGVLAPVGRETPDDDSHGRKARPELSLGALLLAMLLWGILASGVGQPVRAIAVLAFLGGGPALLFGSFVRGPGRLEITVIGLGCAAAASGLVAGAMLATGIWAPQSGLLIVSGLVAAVAITNLAGQLLHRSSLEAQAQPVAPRLELARRAHSHSGEGLSHPVSIQAAAAQTVAATQSPDSAIEALDEREAHAVLRQLRTTQTAGAAQTPESAIDALERRIAELERRLELPHIASSAAVGVET